jgi:3-oxoacyl-[acyl-carrier protein] reductase
MDLGLRGRAAAITGASRGIGRAVALTLAEEGCDVALCARGAADLEATAKAVRARGVRTHVDLCDLADPDAVRRFLEGAYRAFDQRLDVLVNNASALAMGRDEAAWRAGFEVDLLGSVRAAEIVVPWMRAQGGGAIIYVSTTAALEAPSPPAYSALKAAVISYAKNQALELAPHNIRVNTVAPGCIDFPGGLWDQIHRSDPGFYDAMVATIPSGRMGTDQEIANVVVFAASERANWLRGAVISVDGGQHRGNL